MRTPTFPAISLLVLLSFSACQQKSSSEEKEAAKAPAVVADPLFRLLPSSETGVSFSNNLTEGLNTNVLMYEYFYNGGQGAMRLEWTRPDGVRETIARLAPKSHFLGYGLLTRRKTSLRQALSALPNSEEVLASISEVLAKL